MHHIYHHASHDLPIIAELFDVTVEELLSAITFDDTLVMAYVLRLLPQGLKALERRFNGRTRDSYLDIVREPDQQIAEQYLRKLLQSVCSKCGGAGDVIVEPMGAKGKPLPPRPMTCDRCEGDGTAWPSPDERLEYKNGVARIARGHRIGKRIRKALAKLKAQTDTDDDDDDVETFAEFDDSDPDEEPEQSDDDDKPPSGLRTWWMKSVKYDYRLKIEDIAGPMREVSLDDVTPQSKAVNYSAEDADGTLRIYHYLDAQITAADNPHHPTDGSPTPRPPADAPSLRRIYEIDRDTIPLLTVMMERGTYIDIPYMKKLDARLESDCDRLLYQLQEEVGHYVNPGSPKQVAELLFDELDLPVVRETKKEGNPSTQDKVLEDLKLQVASWPNSRHNDRAITVLNYITDYRERSKLRGTYTLALPRVADKDSRIHTTFKHTRTSTNRLSSSGPNLQNIPARTELGQLVRGAFCATPGYSLVAVDLSQIEVRVIAHASKDKRLVEGIRAGLDVHYVTAATIFRIPIDKVTKRQRAIAKRITFLILYGGSAGRLKAELKLDGIDITDVEAQSYIDAYLTVAYPGIGDFMDDMTAHAKRYGYVEDMFGWRRYLPGVHSPLDGVRLEAERMATNSPIQSGAAGIMRLACPVIFREVIPKVRRAGWDAHALLTVHDEVVTEVKIGGEELMLRELNRAMTTVVTLDVPTLAEGKAGQRWNQLKAA